MAKKVPSAVKQIQNYTLMDKEDNKTVSFSQLQTYLSCPHKWDLQYRQKVLPFEQSIHTTFGTAFHELMQHYLTVMYTETAKAADQIDAPHYLLERLQHNYKEGVAQNGQHYSTKQQLAEFYEDGLAIFEWFRKKRTAYFTTKGWHLVGVEIPLLTPAFEGNRNVLYKGFIDLVLYDENSDKYYIYDIKTSTRGWGDREKKDPYKVAQVLLYKKFYSQQFNVSEDQIEVEFFIVKRKLMENCDFPQKRVQLFKPTQGTAKVKAAVSLVHEFITDCFDQDGKPIDKQHKQNFSEHSCKFCPFVNRNDLCSKP
jgi:hypothetical protein